MIDAVFYGGCGTCKHSWGEENCKGCLWDGKSQHNTHWKPQEPFINKPCVSERACHKDKMKVLEKIRAEIEKFAENPNFGDLSLGASCGAMKAIEIINKYMTESDDKE